MTTGHPTVLVTGASRGIGAATARLAAQRGYQVCINYRRDEAAAQALVEAIRADGGRAEAFGADVSREDEVLALFGFVDRTFGPLSGLVNNAGMLERQMRLDEMPADRLQRLLATNVFGALLCAREAVRRMSSRHGGAGGAIVNVSSAASRLGSPGEYIDYAATKGAIDSLTLGLSKEVAAEGVRVNAVRPAFIHTDIHASGGEPDRIQRVQGSIPMQRGGTAEEVAHAIVWLLSAEASYVTGSFIELAGGK
ncbi:SDR family oxidoreductase [Stutzerimonas urumqiensis]|uniref:SDR family oxidoreductase n=1 Tax=Stutzerimonas urumqiensis TaxID=638269 RepID=UPI003DA5DA11